MTPNITFQPNKIFVRNNLFEEIIKSCKAADLKFLKLKERLGLYIYEEICHKKEFILMPKKCFIKHDFENKQLKEENEKVETRNEKVETRNEKLEITNKNKQFTKNSTLKEEPKKIKSLNWFDKNKFKGILTIIDSNEFSYKNEISEFKYTEVEDFANKIKNNTISEIDA